MTKKDVLEELKRVEIKTKEIVEKSKRAEKLISSLL